MLKENKAEIDIQATERMAKKFMIIAKEGGEIQRVVKAYEEGMLIGIDIGREAEREKQKSKI